MADFFSIEKKIRRYNEEKGEIQIFESIVTAKREGKRSLAICSPDGASDYLLNLLRSYGLKAHNIIVKDGSEVCIVQW